VAELTQRVATELKVCLGRARFTGVTYADIMDEHEACGEYDVDNLDVGSREGVLPLVTS
jgi:hypothetical protein